MSSLESRLPSYNSRLLFSTVEVRFGNYEVLEHAAADDSFVDDARHIFRLHTAVPNLLRIQHDCGTEFALVQATGFVGTVERTELAFF